MLIPDLKTQIAADVTDKVAVNSISPGNVGDNLDQLASEVRDRGYVTVASTGSLGTTNSNNTKLVLIKDVGFFMDSATGPANGTTIFAGVGGRFWVLAFDINGGAITDGDKGDITVSSSGSVWTIDNAAVSIAKINATGTPDNTKFLRGDGVWAAPAGGTLSDGDKGDITVASSGAVWTIDNGVIGLAKLSATGTPDNTKFLRGDNTWAVPAGGSLSDGDKGDITVASSGSVWTVDNAAITNAKLRNSSALSIIGRSADTSGSPADIVAGKNEDIPMRNGNVVQFAQPNLVKRQGNVIGDILVRDSFSDLTDFTDDSAGCTITVSGGVIHVDGHTQSGAGSFANVASLYVTDWTSLDVMTLEAVISFPETNQAADSEYGVNFGVLGGNSGYSVLGSMYGAFDSNLGALTIVQLQSSTANNLVTNLGGGDNVPSIGVGDLIHYKLELYENTVTWSVRNVTDNTAWKSITYTYTDTNTKHSAGHVAFTFSLAKVDIHSIRISSKQIKNPDVYLFGDSKFTKGTYQNESLPALLKNHYGQVVANSGVGDTTARMINTLPEVINLVQPKKVLIAVSNDIRFGVSSGTWQANIDQLHDDLTAAGIEVVFCSMYETGASQAAMDTYLTANYPTKYISKVYTTLANNPGVLLGDGIHLSAFGNQLAANEIMLDGKLDAAAGGGGGFTNLTQFTTQTAWRLFYSDASGDVQELALGANGEVLTSNGATSAPSWTAPSASVNWNSIGNPTGDLALTFGAGESTTFTDQNTTEDCFTINNATSTTSSLISLNRTSTALSTGNNLLEVVSSGANAASTAVATGIRISITNTGTSSKNVGLDITCSGGTFNYAAIFSGYVGMGQSAPQTTLHVGGGGTATAFSPSNLVFLASNNGSAVYGSFLGPSGAELYFGSESGQGILGMVTNHKLLFRTNNTTRLTIESDGRLHGSALHNNGGAVTGTTNQYVASGTYTPTLNNTTNVASSNAYVCQWIRVGNVVTVSGKFDITPTAGASSTVLGMSLPIASAFTQQEQLGGTAAGIDGTTNVPISIKADDTNDRAFLVFTSVGTGAVNYYFTFTYLIL